MSSKNRIDLNAWIDSQLPTNGVQGVTAAQERAALKAIVESVPNILDDGSALITTNGVPPSTLGHDNFFAIDPAAKILYGPKSNGTWPAGVSLKGDPGINGTNGTNGTNGINGVKGDPGVNGTNGTKGDPGLNGTNDTNGTNGTNGVNGAPGLTGSGSGDMLRASNLSDLASAATARTNLGLGAAAVKAVVTVSAGSGDVGKIPILDATGKLDASALPPSSGGGSASQTSEAAIAVSDATAKTCTRPTGSTDHTLHITLSAGSGPFICNCALNTTNAPALNNQISITVDFVASANGVINFQSGGVTKATFDNPSALAGSKTLVFDWDGTSAWRAISTSDGIDDSVGFGFDSGDGSNLTAGIIQTAPMPYPGKITGYQVSVTPSGSISFDVKKGTPSGGALTTASIVASAPPGITSQSESDSTTLTGWTTNFNAGDRLQVVTSGTPTVATAKLRILFSR